MLLSDFYHHLFPLRSLFRLLFFLSLFVPLACAANRPQDSALVQVEQTQVEQTQAEQTQAEQTQAEQTQAEQTQDEQTQDEQTQDEQTRDEQTRDEQTRDEQTRDEQTLVGQVQDALVEYLPQGNERLEYKVGFLWFDRLADGAMSLERLSAPGQYRATLEVKTRGMAALFTRNRSERYQSHLRLGANGYFHSQSFVTRRYKGKGDRRTDRGKALFFDAERGEALYQRSKNGKLTSEKRLELPARHEVFDFLCAYWNLRLGMFGPLLPGTRLVIPSYSFKGESDIVVEVLNAEEQADLTYFPSGGVMCRIYLDEELFDTGGGKLYVWFNDNRQLGKGVVVDVLGLGDVRGTMIRARDFEAEPIPLQSTERPIHIESAVMNP